MNVMAISRQAISRFGYRFPYLINWPLFMPIAAILLVAGNLPGNISRYVKHPMLTGIALWAFLHLLANGDLSSTIIFIIWAAMRFTDA